MTHDEKLKADAVYREANREQLRAAANDYYAKSTPEQRAQWNALARARYHANAEERRARRRKYHHDHRETINARQNAAVKKRRLENLEEARKKAREVYWKNPERHRAETRRYYEQNKDKVLAAGKERYTKDVKELADWYIRTLLDLKKADTPQELIEAKRELVRLRRLIRDGQNSEPTEADSTPDIPS